MDIYKHFNSLSLSETIQSTPLIDIHLNNTIDLINNITININININSTLTDTNMDTIHESSLEHKTLENISNELFNNSEDDILDLYNPRNKYYNKIRLEPPNVYCNVNFDDEDFIYRKIGLPSHIEQYIIDNENELLLNYYTILDSDITYDNAASVVYSRIIYLFKFINYYYSDKLKKQSEKQKIMQLPQEIFIWIDNLVCILRKLLNSDIYCSEDTNDTNASNASNDINVNNSENTNKHIYFKELTYGLNIIICHIKMILNHNTAMKIPFWLMEDKCIHKFFRIMNNMCSIIIFMKYESIT